MRLKFAMKIKTSLIVGSAQRYLEESGYLQAFTICDNSGVAGQWNVEDS